MVIVAAVQTTIEYAPKVRDYVKEQIEKFKNKKNG